MPPAIKSALALIFFAFFCALSAYFLNPFSAGGFLDSTPPTPPTDWSNLDPNVGLRPAPGSPLAVTPLEQITVQVQGQTTVLNSRDLYARQMGQTTTDSGAVAYVVEYDEMGANALVTQLWQEYVPEETKTNLRNPTIALQPGGVALQLQANTPLGWQNLDLTVDFNEQGTGFTITDARLANISLTNFPELDSLVTQLETEGNAVLQTATVLNGSESVQLSQIYVDEGMLRLMAAGN
jgi:hypothetical protein